MKIILEFNDDEVQRADQAFHGPEYAAAAEDFRNSLRNIIKHEEYSEETGKFLTILEPTTFGL